MQNYASNPEASRGRLVAEEESANRSHFQRDRDRIIHSTAFRRLKHKTQVFVYHEGDHYRTRLTHSIEVAQIARSIARSLGLNEDLAEAVALAHDLGHTPFGHAGEEALAHCMADYGGFDHNEQTFRIVTLLERRYAAFDGLNLTWETLEGLAKHNGPVAKATWALAEADAQFPLELGTWPSLEAQVAAIADDIAYDNHDVDDGLRAVLFRLDDVLDVPLVKANWTAVRARFPDVPQARLLPELIREQIGAMVNDVLAETRRRIADAGVESADDVRRAGRALAGFSGAFAMEERHLKRFLYARMYNAPPVQTVRKEAQRVLTGLFGAYRDDPGLLPPEWRPADAGATATLRAIGDFIAGMTDRYAIRRYEELVGPAHLPEGF